MLWWALSPFASPCAVHSVHALDAGVLVCMLASTSAMSVMLTGRELMRMPCTICTSEMRSSRQWTSLTNIVRSFTVPTDPSCCRRTREPSRLCVYCSGPMSTRASPQVFVQDKKLVQIDVQSSSSSSDECPAARHGIQSITLVAIAGEVLEFGTANASWDVSRRLPKGSRVQRTLYRELCVFDHPHKE